MTLLVTLLAVVVAVQAILLVGLLRGHADVLRRLHELGAGLEDTSSGTGPGSSADAPFPAPTPLATQAGPLPPNEGRRAHDISGLTPDEQVVALRVTGVEHDTLLVFLSSTCAGCQPFWPALEAPDLPEGTRLVIVTREEPDEDLDAVRRLAPPGATVVMSDAAHADHEVPGSPYVVHVEGRSGRIRGEGTAASWDAVRNLLLRGQAQGAAGARAKATADARRERDADRHLLAAGITPGDPSLYQRADGTPVEPPATVERTRP